MQTFHAKQRESNDWVVVHRSDIDGKGNLRTGTEPVSRNHQSEGGALVEVEKLEAKFGEQNASRASQ